MDETTIVNKALDRLNQQTGIQGNWEPRNNDIDGEIDFYFNTGNVHVFIEVKKELREHQLPKLLEMAKRYPPFMVVAERIFPTLKELLREKKIGYLDTAGNIYVQTNGNFIWLDGNKPITEEKPVTNRAFTKTGLKTVFYLLLHEDAINMPYRKLAYATDVALGNIKNVIEGLKDAGFILHVNDKTLRLQNKRLLLDRWIAGYRETLKPALKLGKFRFWNTDQVMDWQTLPIEHGATVWGGEPAAEHLTNYLRPEILTAYTTELRGNIIPKWRLIPDDNGNIQLYKKFWKDDFADPEPFAPPLLIYADLLLTDDPRCRETAEMIYNQFLKHEFEQY